MFLGYVDVYGLSVDLNQDLQDLGDFQDCDDALHRFMDCVLF